MGTCITIAVKAEKNTKSYGTIFFCCFPLAREETISSLFLSPDQAWPLGQKLGPLLHSQSLSPLQFSILSPSPSRFPIERVQGTGLVLESLNTGTPQHVHSQLLPQDHRWSLLPAVAAGPLRSKPAPPSSDTWFRKARRLRGGERAGSGFAPVGNNDLTQIRPGVATGCPPGAWPSEARAIPASPGRAPRDRVWGERRGPTQPAVTTEPTAARPAPAAPDPSHFSRAERWGSRACGPGPASQIQDLSRPDTLRPRPVPPAGPWARRRARTKPVGGAALTRALGITAPGPRLRGLGPTRGSGRAPPPPLQA